MANSESNHGSLLNNSWFIDKQYARSIRTKIPVGSTGFSFWFMDRARAFLRHKNILSAIFRGPHLRLVESALVEFNGMVRLGRFVAADCPYLSRP